MSQTVKRIVTAVLLATVLLVMIAVAAVVLFPAEKIRTVTEKRASEFLGKPVRIGTASISFRGTPSLKLTDITAGETSDGGEPLFTMKSVFIRVRLLKLLSRRIEMTLIEMNEPRLLIHGLPKSAATQAPEKENIAGRADTGGPPNIPFPLTLKSFLIKNASFAFERGEGDSTSFRAVDIDAAMTFSVSRDLKQLDSDGSVSVNDISLAPDPKKEPLKGISARFDYTLDGDISTGAFTLSDGRLLVNGIPFDVSAAVRNWTVLSAALSSGDLDAAALIRALPEGLIPKRDHLNTKGSINFHAEGSLDSADSNAKPQFSGALDALIESLSYDSLPKRAENIAARLTFSEREIDLAEFRANVGTSSMTVSGRAVDYQASPQVSLKAAGNIDLADIGDAFPLPEDMAFSGKVNFDIKSEGNPDYPETLKASGGISLESITAVMPKMLRHPARIDGTLTLKPEALQVTSIAVASGESDFAFKGSLANYMALAGLGKGISRFSGTLTSKNINISDLFVMIEDNKDAAPVKPWDLEKTTATLPIPPNMTGELAIDCGTVRFGRLKSDSVAGLLVFGGGTAELKDIRIQAYSGTLTGGTKLDFTDLQNVRYNGDFRLNALESGGFLADFLDGREMFRGKLSSTLSFSGAGLDSVSMLDNLKAAGDMALVNGQIVNFGLTKQLGDYMKFLDFETLDFESITNSFKVEDRKFITPDMAVATKYGDIRADGFTGFDTVLDYDITFDLDRESSAKALEALSSLTKYLDTKPERLELNVKASGTLMSPKFSLDTSDAEEALKSGLKKQLSDEVDKLLDSKDAEELKQKGKDLLKKIFR